MSRLYINDGWFFTPEYSEDFISGARQGERVRIPHTCREIPFNYCDERDYQMLCGYRRTLDVPAEWLKKRVLVTFGAAAHEATVYLNGEALYTHRCGYTAFTVELTGRLHEGENTLAVRLDTRETLDQPPFGYVIDYLTYGGIYREVWVEVKEPVFIADAFLYPQRITIGKGKRKAEEWRLVGEVTLAGKAALTDGARLSAMVTARDGKTAAKGGWALGELAQAQTAFPETLFAPQEECRRVRFELPVKDVEPWSVDSPALYPVSLTLTDGGASLDSFDSRVGFRTAEFRADGFYLNGERLRLRGLNRHQSYPYVGYAMPASMQRLDADLLKRELGVNFVRTSHYPQSHHFIDRCDELGLLVFTEIPGWQHVGGEEWKRQAVLNTAEMVTQYRNHASVILWGVRINESLDDDALYTETNALSRALDPSRATTGVRYLEKSSLLEDVYAHNDFSCSSGDMVGLKPKKKVTPDMKKAYFVSECNGHMYPTKSYDDEEHRLEHARRHTAVLAAMYASKDIAGCMGWCMFDYNTHKDFGSGDRICYHGVTDMFRNRKLAAYVYASQSDIEPVLRISSAMLIGDHPASVLGKVFAYTNADSVRLYKNDCCVTEFYPDRSRYPGMPHPPIAIDDFIGDMLVEQEGYKPNVARRVKKCLTSAAKHGVEHLPLGTKLGLLRLMLRDGFKMDDAVRLYGKYVGSWGGVASLYRFEAYKDGEAVASVVCGDTSEVQLRTLVSSERLHEGTTYDVALVRVEAVGEYGNRLDYFGEPLSVRCEGAVELVGPRFVAMRGGAAGVFVRTLGVEGEGRLILSLAGQPDRQIDFTVTLE